jgi:hypothetical protein
MYFNDANANPQNYTYKKDSMETKEMNQPIKKE